MIAIIGFLIFVSSCVVPVTKIVFLGDSITAGYNIAKESAFPSLIQAKVPTDHIQIINAGVSGDTSFMLLNRLDWILARTTPNIAVVCIGANDGLRGVSPKIIQENLTNIVRKLQENDIQVILAGITLPENYSQQYIHDFESIYNHVAEKNLLIYIPQILEGVAGIDSLNLSDRIHPNKEGHKRIADTVFNALLNHQIVSVTSNRENNK